jgi:hypothetical protein
MGGDTVRSPHADAGVAELADALGLGPSLFGGGGSSPLARTPFGPTRFLRRLSCRSELVGARPDDLIGGVVAHIGRV